MRKFLLTFVVLVAGAMSAWAEGVAKIGDVSYASLAEAVNAAQDDETIVLLQDFNIESDLSNAAKGVYNIAEGKSLTLDLGGYTITATDNSKGNFILFYNYGELTVKNGTINLTATINREWNAQSSIILNRGGVLTIESGSYVHNGGTDMAIAVDNSGNSFGDAYLTVAGGTIQSTYIAIRNRMADTSLNGNPGNGEARITVTDGVIKGTKRGVWGQITNPSTNALGSIEITGGTLEGGEDAIKLAADDADNIVVSISGTAVINGNISGDANDLASSITGGTFTTDVTAYCAEGFVIEDNGDGTFGVVEKPTTYDINSLNDFIKFRDAVNNGNNFAGKTVRLNVDLDLYETEEDDWRVNIGDDGNIAFAGIFDGQGHKISNVNNLQIKKADGRIYAGLFGAISGNAVIKNFTVENVNVFTSELVGNYVGAVVGYAENVTGGIENVQVTGTIQINSNGVMGVGAIVGYDKCSPSLKIKNCKVSGIVKSAIVAGDAYVGGLIGYASNGVTIEGNVVNQLKVEGTEYVGGLVGYASNDVVIVGNTVQDLTVLGTKSVGAIAGGMLAGGKAYNNTVKNVNLISTTSAGVVAGTINGKVTIDGLVTDEVIFNNGTEKIESVGSAVKVGTVYYGTLNEAVTEGGDNTIQVKLLGKHTLADEESYEYTKNVEVTGDLTYTRNLTANWNPIYFPFDYTFNTADYTLAEFVGGEGATLTLQLVENGELVANKAYVIRPKREAARELTIYLDGSTLVPAAVTKLKLGENFVLLGNNEKVNGAALSAMLEKKYPDSDFQTPRVVGKDGSWGILGKDTNLKPYRLILAGPAIVGQKAISMRILSGTTVVEEVVLDAQEAEIIFDLMGRRVETMTKGEIYIVNGKKVIF